MFYFLSSVRMKKILLTFIPLKPFLVLQSFPPKLTKANTLQQVNEKIILYHQLIGFECKQSHIPDGLGVPQCLLHGRLLVRSLLLPTASHL